MSKYKALVEYNYYDGPIMFTAARPRQIGSLTMNDIFWCVWEDENEDFSRMYAVYALTPDEGTEIGTLIEVAHEYEFDFTEMEK